MTHESVCDGGRAMLERLEERRLLSAFPPHGAFADVNISRLAGHQQEGTITANPTNPANLFAASNNISGGGLFAAFSTDGGLSWSGRLLGTGSDGLVPACCDPVSSFDGFGNLFLTYLSADSNSVQVILSTDGGRTFSPLTQFVGNVDRPSLATGPGSVWTTFSFNGAVVAAGAAVSALGNVAAFGALQTLSTSTTDNVRSLAVGPQGEVLVAYPRPRSGNTTSSLLAQLDPDGLGPLAFRPPVTIGSTNVNGFDAIPPQPIRTIDSAPNLAFDRSNGPQRGRVYLVYTDEFPNESGNTDIYLRWSDNQGAGWSQPLRVNDDAGTNAQFFPGLAVDPTSGNLAVSWYDARNDLGIPGPGNLDGLPNNDVQFWGTFGAPTATGVDFRPNFPISAGTSSATLIADPNEYGDYTTTAFYGSRFYPVWGDNSDAIGDNPDDHTGKLDLYTAAVPIDLEAPSAMMENASRLTSAGGDHADVVVTYADNVVLNGASFDAGDLRLRRGDGAQLTVSQASVDQSSNGSPRTVTYTVQAPGGAWDVADNGVYVVELLGDQVTDWAGNAAPAGALGSFEVAITPPPVIARALRDSDVLIAPSAGGGPNVRAVDALSGQMVQSYFVYDVNYIGGVRLAGGDVDGDGVLDVITGPGPGAAANVRVFSGVDGRELNSPLGSFFAFDTGFLGGVFLASGDVNGDGHAEVMVAADAGAGPHVKVFDGASGQVIQSFFAFDVGFAGGVRLAAGDINGDGRAEIITGAASAIPHVRIFSAERGDLLASFFAYDGFAGGVTLAAGDVNGDGRDEVLTGTQVGPAHVKAFDVTDFLAPPVLRSFFAFDSPFAGGVRVAASDVNGDGIDEILAATGPGAARLRVFAAQALLADWSAYDEFAGGVEIGDSQ